VGIPRPTPAPLKRRASSGRRRRRASRAPCGCAQAEDAATATASPPALTQGIALPQAVRGLTMRDHTLRQGIFLIPRQWTPNVLSHVISRHRPRTGARCLCDGPRRASQGPRQCEVSADASFPCDGGLRGARRELHRARDRWSGVPRTSQARRGDEVPRDRQRGEDQPHPRGYENSGISEARQRGRAVRSVTAFRHGSRPFSTTLTASLGTIRQHARRPPPHRHSSRPDCLVQGVQKEKPGPASPGFPVRTLMRKPLRKRRGSRSTLKDSRSRRNNFYVSTMTRGDSRSAVVGTCVARGRSGTAT